jgi:hypothetical protein
MNEQYEHHIEFDQNIDEFFFIEAAHDLESTQPDRTALDTAHHMIALMHLMKDLHNFRGTLFKIADESDDAWAGRIICPYHAQHKNYILFNEIINKIKLWNFQMSYQLPLHELNPMYNFFFEEAYRFGLYMPHWEFEMIFLGRGDLTAKMCTNLNLFVESLRSFDQNRPLCEAIKRFKRASHDNYLSATKYINALFAIHSRMMAIRVDLSYRKREQQSDTSYLANMHGSIDSFLSHRTKLLEQLQRHPLFKHLLGYLMKIEHGRVKGLHLHCLFLFNSSEVREHITIGTMIGRFWVNDITNGMGLFYNCNMHPKYFYNGVGMVNNYDAHKRVGLDYAVTYMTKPDGIARLALGNTRIFIRGKMPHVPAVKLGRPRLRG